MTRAHTDIRHLDTIIVGGGQAALAAGYYLRQQARDFLILDAAARIGDSWRRRWETLVLFTPAAFNNLPGRPFPGPGDHLPTRDEIADYLVDYAAHFQLPLQLETRVDRLARRGRDFLLVTNRGLFTAKHVIVATGAYQRPRVPDFAGELDGAITQLTAAQYKRPDALPDGDVVIVGAGNSGAQIALDIAAGRPHRQVWLSGRDTGQMKRRILGRDIFWWMSKTLFKVRVDSRLGQKLKKKMGGRGTALLDISAADLARLGIQRVARIEGVLDGRPRTAAGQTIPADIVIWATGYRPDFSWIEAPIFGPHGYPQHTRGVVAGEPGLYFLGLPFLYRPNSSLVGGVGADAAHIVDHLAAAHAPGGTPVRDDQSSGAGLSRLSSPESS